ncbi:hypothetical protein OJAV_G00169770 [Oryzias javanicus]|uniref:Retrotransposon gag domain-containing protein n=1 Tax=Oryzias javanicus TaxID=123683 RepID=A0A3S2NX18_ORYJA|nr:hypothetical protein OJAV_G00169770 [Oryzias javanicus]
MESVKPPEAAIGLDAKPDARKIALLLTVAGPQAVDVFNTFVFVDAGDRDKFDAVLLKFDEHCSPKKNETYERYVFRSRLQQLTESFDAFVTDLKLKARTCNFGVLQDSMIRDQVVFGVKDRKVRERLLRETDLTLADAVKICQAGELALQHAKTFSDGPGDATPDGAAVAVVSKRRDKRRAAGGDSRLTQTRSSVKAAERQGACEDRGGDIPL